jgi:hypothetical protein
VGLARRSRGRSAISAPLSEIGVTSVDFECFDPEDFDSSDCFESFVGFDSAGVTDPMVPVDPPLLEGDVDVPVVEPPVGVDPEAVEPPDCVDPLLVVAVEGLFDSEPDLVGGLAEPPEDDAVEDDDVLDGVLLSGVLAGGALAPGAPCVDGAALGGLGDDGLLRTRRGGASVVSMPIGTLSLFFVFGFSLPAGTQLPVASHGIGTLAALLCSAAPTVNRPSELPVRSTS